MIAPSYNGSGSGGNARNPAQFFPFQGGSYQGRSAAGARRLEKVPVPQFENQKLPQDAGVIAPLPKMLFEQLPHGGRPEIAALEGPRLDEDAQFVLQLVSHPVHERQGETALGLLQDRARHADSFRQLP